MLSSEERETQIVELPVHVGTASAGAVPHAFSGMLVPSLVPVVVILLAAGVLAVRIQERRRRHVPVTGPDVGFHDETGTQHTLADLIGTLFCPVCGSEFLKTAGSCEDCGVDLVEENELPEFEMRIEQDVIRIARVMRFGDVHMIRDLLDMNRVPSMIARWGFAGADVYVLESDALRARRLIGQCLPTA